MDALEDIKSGREGLQISLDSGFARGIRGSELASGTQAVAIFAQGGASDPICGIASTNCSSTITCRIRSARASSG